MTTIKVIKKQHAKTLTPKAILYASGKSIRMNAGARNLLKVNDFDKVKFNISVKNGEILLAMSDSGLYNAQVRLNNIYMGGAIIYGLLNVPSDKDIEFSVTKQCNNTLKLTPCQ